MAFHFTNWAEESALSHLINVVPNGTLKIALFTNDVTPDESFVIADLVIASGNASDPVPISFGPVSQDAGGRAKVSAPTVLFTPSENTPQGTTAFGYALVYADAFGILTSLLGAERFSTPVDISLGQNQVSVECTLYAKNKGGIP